MIPIEIEVYDRSDVFTKVDVLNSRQEPTFLDELRGPGGGSLSIPINDPKILLNPSLLQPRNVLRVKVDEETVGAIVISEKTPKILQRDTASELIEVSGESLRTWLNEAVIYPEVGLGDSTYDNRGFNFSSVQGTWYNASQWVAPTLLVKRSEGLPDDETYTEGDNPWRYKPKDWPDAPDATWVWGGSGTVTSAPAGDGYLRYEFSVATAGSYSFYIASSDPYLAYCDSQQVTAMNSSDDPSLNMARVELKLSAGSHIFGLKVSHEDATKPAGALVALFREGDASADPPVPAELISYTGKTGDSNWKINAYPSVPPGWSPGEILRVLLDEAQARGVTLKDRFHLTFSDTTDSYGVAWGTPLEWQFDIGDSIASAVLKMEELACDLWTEAEPDETGKYPLNLALQRGVDRSIYDEGAHKYPIIFQPGKDLGESKITTKTDLRNVLMVRTPSGWMEVTDSTSVSAYGRIESKLDAPTSSLQVIDAVTDYVFSKKATPETGAVYKIIATEGHEPFKDFQVGDWVLAPNELKQPTRRRVMSISCAEQSGSTQPTFEVEFDTIFQDNEDKLNQWMTKMGGSLSGQFSNSGSGSGVASGTPTIVSPSTTTSVNVPKQVLNLLADSSSSWEYSGIRPTTTVTLDWDAVTSNTLGETITPWAYEIYEQEYVGLVAQGWKFKTRVFTNSAVLIGYAPDTTFDFKVRALTRDSLGQIAGVGAFSGVTNLVLSAPTSAPPTPSSPTLAVIGRGLLSIRWDGLDSVGATMPNEVRSVFVLMASHGSGNWVRLGVSLERGDQTTVQGIVGSTYDVTFTAVDGAGNESATSTIATSSTITGIVGADIEVDSVSANVLQAGAALVAKVQGTVPDLELSANESIILTVSGAVDPVASDLASVSADLATQQTSFRVTPSGTEVSKPGAAIKQVSDNDSIAFVVAATGTVLSEWTALGFTIPTVNLEEANFGNHYVKKRGTSETVVKAK